MAKHADPDISARHEALLRELAAKLGTGRAAGLSAVFCGGSGAARLAAAEAIARTSALPLHRIDLQRVASKYTDETEKNLRKVLDAAEAGAAVLFFDEADALFGKRSEVKDGHDRRQAAAVEYLLHRIERYRGLVVLAAERAIPVDSAVSHGVRFVIDFPASSGRAKPHLPDLSNAVDQAIESIHLRAVEILYLAAMLDALKMFQVADRLVELFSSGVLPLGASEARERVSTYWRQSDNRLSDAARRNLYDRVFGVPGGDDDGSSNRQFDELWLRFISSVSSDTAREIRLREAARELATNLSRYGCGITLYAATELGECIHAMFELLGAPEITAAYGARDMWQVVDRVATVDLGGAKDAVRYSTLAASGAVVLAWLSTHLPVICSADTGPLLDIEASRHVPHPLGTTALSCPSDDDLVNACALWLAASAGVEGQIGEPSQPTKALPATHPVDRVPALARDMLTAIGIGEGSV